MTVYIKSLASHLKKKESPFVWVVSIKQILYQIQGYFGPIIHCFWSHILKSKRNAIKPFLCNKMQ